MRGSEPPASAAPRELLGAIEAATRALLAVHAPAAVERDPHAMRVVRSATVVFRIAELLRRLPTASPGDLRILASRLRALSELAGADELGRLRGALDELLHEEDAESDRLALESALRKRTG
jgi:hypothetical protein